MIRVDEVEAGSTHRVAAAMLALRPQAGPAEALVDMVDTCLRPQGGG